MLIYFDKNRKITAYTGITQAEADLIMERNPFCAWYKGEFSFFMGEYKPGFEKAFYLDKDGTIRIEYEPLGISTPLSEQEQIAIDTALNVEYIACLLEANLQ